MRDVFGSWGRELPPDRFAHALLGLGLIPGHLRGTARPPAAERALAGELAGDPDTLLIWSLDALPTESTRWPAGLSAERLADTVAVALHPARRVSIQAGGALDAVAAWGLLHPSGSSDAFPDWAFCIHASTPDTPVRFGWPCRVGYFPDRPAAEIARRLAAIDDWSGAVYELVPLTPRNPRCDLLLWRDGGTIGELIERLSAAGRPLGGVATGLLLVLADDLAAAGHGLEPLLRLRATVEATGLLLAPSPRGETAAAWFVRGLFVALAHNLPLEVAVAAAAAQTGGWDGDRRLGPGLLIANERLPERARVEAQARELVRALQRSVAATDLLVSLDPQDAFRLSLGPQAISRQEVARRLDDALDRGLGWDREADGASTVGRIRRSLEAQQAERPVPRFLQAAFEDPGQPGLPLSPPLAAAREYSVAVFVGRRRTGFAVGGTPFPTLAPPPTGRTHRLTLVLTEAMPLARPQFRSLELPIEGDSEPCRFTLWTRGEGTLSARLTVLHRNRVLQTGLLTAPVGGPGEIMLTLDVQPRVLLEGLEERLTSDAAFVVADDGAGASVHTFDGEGAAVLDLEDSTIESLNQVIAQAIGDITTNPDRFNGLRAPGSQELLRQLAQKGSRLREVLQRYALRRGSLGRPRHLQIVAATPGRLLPIEFLYDGEPPEADAEICAGAEEALRTGACPAGCPTRPGADGGGPAAADGTICPLAFWGLSAVIERHAPRRIDGGDFLVLTEPVSAEKRLLSPLASAVVAAAERANRKDEKAVESMLDRIRQVIPGAIQAVDWNEWVTALAEHRPSLLALLVHVDHDAHGTPELEIGKGPPRLSSDLIKPKHVRPDEDCPTPVALLIGCESAHASRPYESCALRLQEEGAVFVVSSVAAVLGRQAAPMTAELVEAIAAVREPTPFGRVLRDFRRRLLLDGTPMVLALTALGDADWEIAPAS